MLDVVFGDDQTRPRTGHGANTMAIVRHFAINLVRAVSDRKTIKLGRKRAARDVTYLAAILGLPPRQPGIGALRSTPCPRHPCPIARLV